MSAAMSPTDLWMALAFLPVLAATAYGDLRNMKIPNMLSLGGLALFVWFLPVIGFDDWLLRALIGAITFALCFALFAIGWFGGGDAKILPVTVLFVPPELFSIYLFAFSAAMLLGMMGIWLLRQRFAHPEAAWVSMRSGAAFPMGISIAASLPIALLFAALF